MPVAFDSCVKNNGRVRTKQLNATQYVHICFINGKSYLGEIKTYKVKPKDNPVKK